MAARGFSVTSLRTTRLPLKKGSSAIAALRDALLLVEDDTGIYRVRGRHAELWAGRDLHESLGDLEGIATDTAHKTVWAVSERQGEVIAVRLSKSRPASVTTLGRLPRPGTKATKGYEGLAYMPARFSPSGTESLVAVHEGKPRRLGIFALPTLEQTHDCRLSDELKDLLDDLADVTVDPVTGLLLLLSDQSRRIAVVRLDSRRDKLELVSSCDLPLGKKDKPEGLDFASKSTLVVVLDNAPELLELTITR